MPPWGSGSTFKPYIEQLLKVATNGNVVVEFAVMENRYLLICTKCREQLCSYQLESSDGAINWSVQEWVKNHRHSSEEETLKRKEQALKEREMRESAMAAYKTSVDIRYGEIVPSKKVIRRFK